MKVFDTITDDLKSWIEVQPLFFIGSAPLAQGGHINVSPRGLDSLRVTGPGRIIILDLTGSGNETAAHLIENQRITVMFCAFEGQPRVLRLFGQGKVILPEQPAWQDMYAQFDTSLPGVRQIFDISISRVQTSCGFGVPLMKLESQRTTLLDWANKKGVEGIQKYQSENNRKSIDGLPSSFDT